MDTLPNPHYSKEMVDLLIRIKKHLLANQDIAIRLSDPDLFDKLVKLHPKDDPLLQGMIQYLMVLAGPQWSELHGNDGIRNGSRHAAGSGDSLGKTLLKKSASLYRGLAGGHEQVRVSGEKPQKSQTEVASTHLENTAPAATDTSDEKPHKPVRYYRGQPIPDN